MAMRFRPSFTEALDLDLAMFNAIIAHLPSLEDGSDLKYVAAMLGKKDS